MIEDPDRERRLTTDFAAWLNQARVPPERFFRSGIVALDANVLLDLYRFTPVARTQVLDAFASIGERLWVPHQAAVEFSRNRKRVVEDRIASFRQVRRLLQTVAADAVTVLESAVARLVDLREHNGTTRTWDVQQAALDRASLRNRLDGVMDNALMEITALETEHDLHLKDMQEVDPVLSLIDDLLAGRIGPAYQSDELRALVDEANTFRYPNEIPPGFLDSAKGTPLQAAGDFILWRQTVDKVRSRPEGDRLVMLITKDFKNDWWELDKKKRPKGPRPELVQEMRDLAKADLLLLSLKDFINGANTYLSFSVSDETLGQIREVSSDVESLLPEVLRNPSDPPNLLDLNFREFERLVHYLLLQLGYGVEVCDSHGDGGCDFILTDGSGPERDFPILVATNFSRGQISVNVLYRVLGEISRSNAKSAMLVTTSRCTKQAREIAESAPLEIIDGRLLLELLRQQGVNARLQTIDEE